MTTLKRLALEMQSVKKELQNMEVFVRAENGILMSPKIKFETKDKGSMDLTKKNVRYIVLEP